MKVLVDTSVWSLALRRTTRAQDNPVIAALMALVEEGRVAIIGPIRQELLSGIKERAHFERLREHLQAFSDTPISSDDYEEAAGFYNRCRAKGVQGSNTDFLICAVAVRNDFPILTDDGDFTHFAQVLPISLYAERQR